MRSAAFLLAVVLVAAGCGDSGIDAGGEAPVTATTEVGVLPEGPSALQTRTDPEFPPPLVDPDDIISGGPPPDGIPPIDAPEFVTVADADNWLQDQEPVVVLVIDGDAKAYPVQILIWHEIVNDTVGDTPVTITYCPLCNSAVSYVRRVRGVETTFGTSGRLFASALVMYDRATETLWTHFDGRAVVGMLAGDRLQTIGSPLFAWADFKEAYPDGLVLDRERTGFARRYGANPYVGYDDPGTFPFLYRGDPDARAQAKERVVGVAVGEEAKAYPLELLSRGEASATLGQVGDTPIVILWKSGQSTALEGAAVFDGRDVGSVGVFVPQAGETALTIRADGGGFVDEETGTEWDVAGRAVSGPLAGAQLERIPHLDTFWFAWATYRPGTELVASPGPAPS